MYRQITCTAPFIFFRVLAHVELLEIFLLLLVQLHTVRHRRLVCTQLERQLVILLLCLLELHLKPLVRRLKLRAYTTELLHSRVQLLVLGLEVANAILAEVALFPHAVNFLSRSLQLQAEVADLKQELLALADLSCPCRLGLVQNSA
jgi:hypothetical protein